MIILQMKSLQLLLLHVLLALLALVTVLSDGSSNSAVLALNRIGLDGVGDRQLLMAFNSALREMIQDGEYYRLLEKWDLQDFSNDECKDKYNPMFQWPENPAHLLNTILVTSESIAWVHDSNLGLPFWNGTAGFEADLAKTITSRIGGHYNKHVEMRWVAPLVNPDGWFQSLYQNLYNLASDIVMSRVFITPERAQLVDYTCGYLYNYNGIIRGTLEPSKNLSTLEQINAPGIQVAVVRGTFYDRLGTTLNQATMYIASSFQLAVEMVAQEQAHVLITDFISAVYLFRTEPTACPNCTVVHYGARNTVASFVRKTYTDYDASSDSSSKASSLLPSHGHIVAVTTAASLVALAVLFGL